MRCTANKSEHHQALQRAEEEGYARGLRDSGRYILRIPHAARCDRAAGGAVMTGLESIEARTQRMLDGMTVNREAFTPSAPSSTPRNWLR